MHPHDGSPPASFDSVPWRATRYPGVAVHFYASDAKTGRVVALIRMAPGHGYPHHRHRGSEEVLVLQGGYRDENGEHTAGSLVRYEAGSSHGPVALGAADAAPGGAASTACDCILLAVAHEGVELLG